MWDCETCKDGSIYYQNEFCKVCENYGIKKGFILKELKAESEE